MTRNEAIDIISSRGLLLSPQPRIRVKFSDGSAGDYHALVHPRTGKYLRQDNTFAEPVKVIDHRTGLTGVPEYFEHAQEAAQWLEKNPQCTTRRKPKASARLPGKKKGPSASASNRR